MSSEVAVKRRPRFSLLTLLLLLTIAAMGAALWRAGREVEPLRREVQALRAETGRLTIDDPAHIHAIQVPTSEIDVARWRLYIPPGRQYYLHYQTSEVPKDGTPPRPNPAGGLPLVGRGQFTFEFRIQNDPRDPGRLVGRLNGRNETQVYGTELELRQRKENWIKHEVTGGRTEAWKGVPTVQRSVAADEPMVLLRLRAQHVKTTYRPNGKVDGWSYKEIDEPTDGVIIWIDRFEH